MVKIAICEDNSVDRAILQNLVKKFVEEKEIQAEVSVFSSGEELVASYECGRYDLIFLDVVMGNIDGIEAGLMIRKKDEHVEIVYCTSSSDFAIAAYDVHAMGYLLKSYDPMKIGNMIDYYMQKYPHKAQRYIELKSQRKTFIVFYEDILCMESENKVVNFHTRDQGIIRVYNKLDYYEKELNDERFLRCHQSFLVNMQHVAEKRETDFIMKDHSIVPIRKSGRREIIRKYQLYRSMHEAAM